MEFVENIAESFLGGGGGGQRTEVIEQQQGFYGGGGPGGPPSVPRPWFAQWSEEDRTYIYINEETGERSFEVPYGGGGGGFQQQEEVYQQQDRFGSNETALGLGAVGMAAGAAMGYEGEKIHNDFDYEKDRIEDDVVDFPENAAEWTGDKVGDVEYAAHEVKEGVEDIPEDVAGWVGDKVGGVERFGDEVSDAFDMGKAEGRDGW